MEGWTHRIDDIPSPGRRIEFRRDGEEPRQGVVLAARDPFYGGCGDDVRIKPDDGALLLIPSKTYAWWRYIDDPTSSPSS